MGRPEKPIVTSNRALRALAEWLREQRTRAGQNYRSLAGRAGLHPTTLQRAASGETVPKLSTVLGYARACDAPPEEAKRLWKQARYEETRARQGGRTLPAPPPALARDFADLSAGLHELYEKAGSPSLRTMEKRAGGYGALPRSTAHRIVNRQAMPHSPAQFQAFLHACEVPEPDVQAWEDAWSRAWRHEKQDADAVDAVADGISRLTRNQSLHATRSHVRGTKIHPVSDVDIVSVPAGPPRSSELTVQVPTGLGRSASARSKRLGFRPTPDIKGQPALPGFNQEGQPRRTPHRPQARDGQLSLPIGTS
ncbi:helix-turn-helix transcriptional regulator [Streptomyces sp. NPDC005407]|uniref:helix-turn-helix domain-containing protein n=1 Tax=Streptomyces sp. NPDC005407 TaxID=3155340 RepID=UPI0033AF695B